MDVLQLLAPMAAGLPVHELALAGAIVAAGYLVLGISGFGSALLVVPAFLWQWPLAFAVPLVLLLDLPAALYHAWLNRRDAHLPEWRRLLPWMLLGVGLGSLLQSRISLPWAQGLLGAGLCLVAISRLRGLLARSAAANSARAPDGQARWAGLACGVVESLFGVCGPVVATWMSRRTRDPHTLRATTALVLATATSLTLASMAVQGQLAASRLWAAWLPLLVVAMAAVRAGQAVARRLQAAQLQAVTWFLVLASGAGLLYRLAAATGTLS